MELIIEGTRSRARPNLRWLDKIRADLEEVSAQVRDTQEGKVAEKLRSKAGKI